VIGSFSNGDVGRSHTNKLSLDPIETEASFADGFEHPSVINAEKATMSKVIFTIPGSIPEGECAEAFLRT
jgi:hypothetical protein